MISALRVIQAPNSLPNAVDDMEVAPDSCIVFLAGTCAPLRTFLEPAASSNTEYASWRGHFADYLSSALCAQPTIVLDPERTDWDSSWGESFEDVRFVTQTRWELQGQDIANVLVFYFQADAKGTVSMLELGEALGQFKTIQRLKEADTRIPQNMTQKRIFVACEPDFWKAGNVNMACSEVGIQVHQNYELLAACVKNSLEMGGSVG